MAYKYTGRARTFNFEGTLYAHPDEYKQHPDFYDHDYNTPIKGMTEERALRMSQDSNLHTFEDTSSGEDILDAATMPTGVDISTIKPGSLEKDAQRQEREAAKMDKAMEAKN